MKTLLLKFAGPLQSWGTDSHFETRHTDFYPSKSAIIGIIAAGIGYRRNEDDKICKLNELDLAVRVDQQGNLMRDYHTAHKYKNSGDSERTYVTNRYYLEDAVFVVAISHKDDEFMGKIESGLQTPWFQPYMGRRSLPVCSDYIIEITNKAAIESLKDCKWQASDWVKRKNTNKMVSLEVYADSHLVGISNSILRKDKVRSFSQKERKFGYRYATRFSIEVINDNVDTYNDDHDILASIGD